MSDEEELRRRTREQVINNPNTQKLAPHEGSNFVRTTVNNEIDRVRDEEARKRRG